MFLYIFFINIKKKKFFISINIIFVRIYSLLNEYFIICGIIILIMLLTFINIQ